MRGQRGTTQRDPGCDGRRDPTALDRRSLLKGASGAAVLALLGPRDVPEAASASVSDLYWVKEIPDQPFWGGGDGHYHAGVDSLLQLMGANGLKFYRSAVESVATGPQGMIASDDVVLIKVNAQWKHRGCTNSDLIRGLVRRVLDHPDGFKGEAVIVENGQGRGSLDCDTSASYGGDRSVQANANDPSHSFRFVAETLLADSRVSLYLLDPIRQRFIQGDDHDQDGYRRFENVSYPCFTTRNGTRVELWEGIWDGSGHRQNLKLINVPVLKHHDTGGSEITGALKHFYGLVSMADGHGAFRHYRGLGQTCGKMVASIRTPVLNIMDAIWVSQGSITGYPAETTTRVNQLLAGQDPVALDYWAAGHILYPIDGNRRHHPSFSGIQRWLKAAKKIINGRGGLYDPAAGILARNANTKPKRMRALEVAAGESFSF